MATTIFDFGLGRERIVVQVMLMLWLCENSVVSLLVLTVVVVVW